MKKYISLYCILTLYLCNNRLYAQPNLSPLGNNRVGTVRAMYADTVANLFYGGGEILSETSPDTCFGMFSWNGSQWQSMEGQNGRLKNRNMIMSMTRFKNALYVGGALSTDHSYYRLLKKTTNDWVPALRPIDTAAITANEGVVNVLFPINDTTMYIGGGFDTLTGVPAQGIVAFDGTQIRRLPNFLPTVLSGSKPNIGSMAYFKGHLYAGGNMNLTANSGYNDMARLDGNHCRK